MLEQALWWDHQIFIWIQDNLRGAMMDDFIAFSRDRWFWLPVYVALLTWLLSRFSRPSLIIAMLMILLVAATDQGSNAIKRSLKRERPCREMYFNEHFKPLIKCSNGFSFPSSHASNHAGAGVFLFMLLGRAGVRRIRYFFLVWPLWIGFAQVFVGVHFPLDVITGWVLGGSMGYLAFRLSRPYLNLADETH